MRARRPPLWMYVIAVPYVAAVMLGWGASLFGPEPPGFTRLLWVKQGPRIPVVYVEPGSPAARAGIEPGDIVIDRAGYRYQLQAGRTYRFEIERRGERKSVDLSFGRKPWSFWIGWRGATLLGMLVNSALCLALALFIAWNRPYDTVARWGALVLAYMAVITGCVLPQSPGLIPAIRDLPLPVSALLAAPFVLTGSTAYGTGLTFLAIFPRRLFRARWPWILIWALVLIWLPLLVYTWTVLLYAPQTFTGLTGTGAAAFNLAAVYMVAFPVVLAWNYFRLGDAGERRRLRVMVTGYLAGMIGVMPLGIIPAATWKPIENLAPAYLASPWPLVSLLIFMALPLCTAHAMLRQRVFDIHLIIRQGLQYAVARGFLLALVPLVAAVLATDLLLHGEEPLAAILRQRGWLYLALGLASYLLHRRQKRWLEALDRRFFRERYDAQRILRAVVEEVRQATAFEKVAPAVAAHIDAALHRESVAILVRRSGEYQVLASHNRTPPPIPVASKLMGLVQLLGKPVEITQTETGWLRRQLPAEETQFLADARLEWLFPIPPVAGHTEALLALGPRRSEEPYSREDQELLEAVVASLALLLERSPAPTPAGPQLLAGRYRLERPLGKGGMGTVYEAVDTELERRVAIKLIRPELMASPEAAARFRREAKAAAAFAHPNVVTVHDFGVAEDQRAYLVMELLHGVTLRQEIRERGRLDARCALEIFRGVCAAVESAHRRRLLHRDLKPENIFLAQAEGVEVTKILDFGVAKSLAADEETRTLADTGPGLLVGTRLYMSPEQLSGGAPAESWDLWALAVVAYEMLAGVHPFPSGGRVMPIQESWDAFFQRALAPDPAARPASAAELLAEFRQAVVA